MAGRFVYCVVLVFFAETALPVMFDENTRWSFENVSVDHAGKVGPSVRFYRNYRPVSTSRLSRKYLRFFGDSRLGFRRRVVVNGTHSCVLSKRCCGFRVRLLPRGIPEVENELWDETIPTITAEKSRRLPVAERSETEASGNGFPFVRKSADIHRYDSHRRRAGSANSRRTRDPKFDFKICY